MSSLPSTSFTRSKWLAFFAELTAKITHHNVVVSIDGCQLLKRLLVSSVSIAAFLQEGALLQSLLDVFVGGVRSERLLGPTAALDDELCLAQHDVIALCVDMAASLHAEGDAYLSLLVLARAGAIVEGLLQVLQRGHPHLTGPVAATLAALLRLPIGRDPSPALLRAVADPPTPTTTSSSASSPPPVALRRHVLELAGLVQGHGALLQDAADILTAVIASTAGATRFAALRLLDLTYRRLRKRKLRRQREARRAGEDGRGDGGHHSYRSVASGDDDGGDRDADATEGHGSSRCGRPAAGTAGDTTVSRRQRASPSKGATDTTVYSDFNVTITGARAAARSGAGDGHLSTDTTASAEAHHADDDDDGDAAGDGSRGRAKGRRGEDRAAGEEEEEEDVSDLVDREASETGYTVPAEVIQTALRAAAEARSHTDFLTALGSLWALAVADGTQLAALLDRDAFIPFRRFLGVAPATREDRVLFAALLRWLGHVMVTSRLLPETTRAVLDVCRAALLPILLEALQRPRQSDCRDGATNATASVGAVAAAGGRGGRWGAGNATVGSTTPSSTASAIIPPSHAAKDAAADIPSSCVALLSFLHIAARACDGADIVAWVQGSGSARGGGGGAAAGLFAVLEQAIRRSEAVRSVLLDTPTTVDGALSDEVYLAAAMRAAHTEDVTITVLGCKLLGATLSAHREALRRALPVASTTAMQLLVPLLLHMAVNNPTVTSAEEGVAASALYRSGPGRARGPSSSSPSSLLQCGARYTTLGECAVATLDACLSFNAQSHLLAVDLAAVLPSLPALSRCTRQSIHAPLRGAVYRALALLCRSPDDLALACAEMPSAVHAAVASVLAYDERGPQWEAAAAAAWLAVVVRIGAAAGPTTERQFDLSRTALPLRLVELAAAAPMNRTTTALLELCAALFQQEQRLHSEAGGRDGTGDRPGPTVVAPYGARSLRHWLRLMQSATAANRKLVGLDKHPIWRRAATQQQQQQQQQHEDRCGAAAHPAVVGAAGEHIFPDVSTADRLARAQQAAENIASQYAYSAGILRGLCGLFTTLPEHRPHFSHELVYSLLASTLALPSPARVVEMLSVRFQTAARQSATLTRAYGEAIQWACELAPAWFNLPAIKGQGAVRGSASTEAAAAAAAQDSNAFVGGVGEGSGGCRDGAACTATPASLPPHPPLPPAILASAARIMADDTLSQRIRCHIPLLVSSVLVAVPVADLPQREQPSSSSSPAHGAKVAGAGVGCAAALFTASMSLKRLTCVSGMQCRLLAAFPAACDEALRRGWLAERIRDLSKLVAVLVGNRGELDAEDTEAFLVTLSLVSSAVANASMPSLDALPASVGAASSSSPDNSLRQLLAASLAEGVRYEHTRLATLRAVRALSASDEGRQCLLHDVASCGEPMARSCFGRILALTLDIPTVWGSDPRERKTMASRSVNRPTSSSAATTAARGGLKSGAAAAPIATPATAAATQRAVREAARLAAADVGFQVLTTVCGKGGSPMFISAFLRHRGVDALESLFRRHDAAAQAAGSAGAAPSFFLADGCAAGSFPMPLLRLAAALSFHAETQKALFSRAGILAVIVDTAGDASDAGCVALLTLRNLCFCPSLKSVLCQDDRLLLTFKAALMGLPTVVPLLVELTAEGAVAANTAGAATLRREIAESGNAAVSDWATRTARDVLDVQHRRQQNTAAAAAAAAPVAAAPAGTLLRRQQLAVSALWALTYDHQRGRTHVRALLFQREPVVAVERLTAGPGRAGIDGAARERLRAVERDLDDDDEDEEEEGDVVDMEEEGAAAASGGGGASQATLHDAKDHRNRPSRPPGVVPASSQRWGEAWVVDGVRALQRLGNDCA